MDADPKCPIQEGRSSAFHAASCSALSAQVGGKHYKALAIQPAEYCQRNRMPYCESSVVRYVTRHREKNGREDIEKAIHCLQLLLEIEYPQNDTPQNDTALAPPPQRLASKNDVPGG